MTVVREHAGHPWYVEGRYYPTALQAKRAWEILERKLTRDPSEDGAGVFRLAPNPDRPSIPTGAPADAYMVVVVTFDKTMIDKAKRLMKGGVEWNPADGMCDSLIYRRARMVEAHNRAGGPAGRLRIRRPESSGAHIHEDGTVDESVREG